MTQTRLKPRVISAHICICKVFSLPDILPLREISAANDDDDGDDDEDAGDDGDVSDQIDGTTVVGGGADGELLPPEVQPWPCRYRWRSDRTPLGSVGAKAVQLFCA